jgi:predicted nuclease of predicted toxin-antitoxin system
MLDGSDKRCTMRVRFQADADLNQITLLATVRRESSIDFQTAEAAGFASLQDRDVLVTAARDGRMLVTHDQKTMPRHFAEFIATETSPGLLVVPQHLTVATVTEDLLLIWFTNERSGLTE